MNTIKNIEYEKTAQQKLQEGVNKLADAVKSTLGPRGRNVIIEQEYGSPKITKDGVSVAKEIFLKDPYENIGAQMVKEVASKTNDDAGDGTTTATVLAQSIIETGFRFLTTGMNPIELKSGIDLATKVVSNKLKEISKPIKDSKQIAQIATISANNDETIGNLIADAMDTVGKNGIITVEESKGIDTYLDTVEGVQFDKGYTSPHFITNAEKMKSELNNPLILLINEKLTNIQDLLPILEHASQTSSELLIVVDEIEGEALATLVVNKLRGILKLCVVKSPSFGDKRKEIMGDIAVVTGATVVSKEFGYSLSDISLEMLGSAEKVVVDKETTTIVDGGGETTDIEERISLIQSQIKNSQNDWEREKLEERLAKLSGGVAVLYIGASSEVEMKEKKDRVDDALHATKAAVDEGIVPGGGTTLLRCTKLLDEITVSTESELFGVDIIKHALQAPIRTILENGGVEPSMIIHNILSHEDENWGYNLKTNEYQDLLKSGVIDPTKVTRAALENATSVAGLLLTTNAVLTNDREEMEKTKQQMPPMGM